MKYLARLHSLSICLPNTQVHENYLGQRPEKKYNCKLEFASLESTVFYHIGRGILPGV